MNEIFFATLAVLSAMAGVVCLIIAWRIWHAHPSSWSRQSEQILFVDRENRWQIRRRMSEDDIDEVLGG